ncbi:hypothetical protein [Rufibacter quisquiliarum]|uniref:Putative transcriptional regulator n=1 Tax=Rufibacter quisquiliarum TaxID=1549639 RepID=A0A839GQY7_9BACT|nr:hypothetical protein [Rufibacter quisquiliarum]MBA9077307.1 putative transcriptional regulator [Rufibacter quisquiliarum]
MSFPFLQKSHAYAARLLHKAGLTVTQIPQAIEVARTTVETWLSRELEKGNVQQAMQVLKGQLQEKGAQVLFDQLKELLLVKLIIHLGIRNALAGSIAGLVLPFVLKRVLELTRQNPALQNWWQEQGWQRHVPTQESIKEKIKTVSQRLSPNRTSEEQPLFI